MGTYGLSTRFSSCSFASSADGNTPMHSVGDVRVQLSHYDHNSRAGAVALRKPRRYAHLVATKLRSNNIGLSHVAPVMRIVVSYNAHCANKWS
jgi:hypothetical protein